MCFNLSYAEAIEWQSLGLNLIGDAEQRASKMEVDPLLRGADDVSRLVSAVDSIKKRHGILIEKALVSAISWVPGWRAERQTKVQFGGNILSSIASHTMPLLGNFMFLNARVDIQLAMLTHFARLTLGWQR